MNNVLAYPQSSRYFTVLCSISVLLLMLLGVSHLHTGSVTYAVEDVWQAIIGGGNAEAVDVIWHLRLPRLAIAAIVGAHFAVAGAVLQTILRNPLADSHLLGVSAGGSLGAVLVFLFSPLFGMLFDITVNPLDWLVTAAIVGGLISSFVIYLLSRGGALDPFRLILNGIALASILNALVAGLLAGWGHANAETILAWLAGSLYGRDWVNLYHLLPWTLGAMLVLPWLVMPLNLLQLGDDVARGLGVSVSARRLQALIVVAVLSASAVGVVGPVGFVGLIVPHMVRALVGDDLRYVIPLSALFGSLLVVASDMVARTVTAPDEIPVGVVTSLLGVPFFVYLMRRVKH